MQHLSRRASVPVMQLAAAIATLGPAVLLSSTALPAFARDRITLTLDGTPRTAWVDPGQDAATTPSPVVIAFHASGGAGADLTTAGAGPRYFPSGVSIGAAGNLVIADPLNHRIWKASGVAAPGLLAGQPFPLVPRPPEVAQTARP